MSEWISVEDRLPGYGKPVNIVINNVVQNITYYFDADDTETVGWFAPVFFDNDTEYYVSVDDVNLWQPLPQPPKCE